MESKRRKLDIEDTEAIPGIQDRDVGITEFVSPEVPGFTGKIKQRFSDFQVNEIDPRGKVVVFKQTSVAGPPSETVPAVEKRENSKSEPAEVPIEKSSSSEELTGIIGNVLVEQCFDLANKGGEKLTTELVDSKDERTRIHVLIREAFSSRLDSTTEGGKVVIQKANKKSRKRNSQRKSAGEKEDFLHFTLYKENKDTLEAVTLISRILHVPAKVITFAGTKDRRAATAQRVAWRGGTPARLDGLNGALKESIRVGDYEYSNSPIKLGDLTGNEFWIVIRDVAPQSLGDFEPGLISLRDRGFVNYFGLQRFGTFSVPSHVIGKHILRNDFDSAVNGILDPQNITLNDSREAREVWAKERDAARALELMPRRCVAESCLLTALKDSPNALNALMRIPHSLKTMYVHAYQSFVWNQAASKRLLLNRHDIIVGDLVFTESSGNIKRARVVSQEDINGGKLTIRDVVLPTPGFDILYPENLVSFYEKIMGADEIDCHNMRRKIKEFSLFGSYRHLIANPSGVEWFTRRYKDENDTIVYTNPEEQSIGAKFAPEPEEGPDTRLSLVLKLGLATSQYATMALREVMKCDTGRHGSMYYSTP